MIRVMWSSPGPATAVEARERGLGLLEVSSRSEQQARRRVAPVATEPDGVGLVDAGSAHLVGQFDDACDVLTPLLLEQAAVLRQFVGQGGVGPGQGDVTGHGFAFASWMTE